MTIRFSDYPVVDLTNAVFLDSQPRHHLLLACCKTNLLFVQNILYCTALYGALALEKWFVLWAFASRTPVSTSPPQRSVGLSVLAADLKTKLVPSNYVYHRVAQLMSLWKKISRYSPKTKPSCCRPVYWSWYVLCGLCWIYAYRVIVWVATDESPSLIGTPV